MRTRLRWRLTAALLVTVFAVAGCKQIGSNGYAVGGSSGTGALTVHPGFRVGGVWVGQHRGTAYRWLPAAAAASAGLTLMSHLLGPISQTGYGSMGEVPFGDTNRCHNNDGNLGLSVRDRIVVERWVAPTGGTAGHAAKLFVTCKFIRKIWKKFPHVTGKQILACITWLFARSAPGAGLGLGQANVWKAAGRGWVRAAASGEIEHASPAGGDWVRCAEGG